jgi:putative ABC transport system permease protein
VDLFALARVTPAACHGRRRGRRPLCDALADDSIFLSSAAQAALGLKPGDEIEFQAGRRRLALQGCRRCCPVRGERRLAVMDIAAVQSHFGKLGRLTRIDLKLAEGVMPEARHARPLQAILPAGVLIEAAGGGRGQAANLSRAYRVNLTLLAAIALLTGGFLVFSAQALSVVRRRTSSPFLRASGLARRSLFGWLLAEGAMVGLAGGVVGVALGTRLAWGALAVLGGDLGAGYFSGLSRAAVSAQVTAIYVALGLLAGMAGAWLPAREAATVSPAQALKAGDEAALLGGHGHPWLGLTLLLASLAACAIPPLDGLPVGGYLAVACLLAGGVMLLPALASRDCPSACRRAGPVPARLAAARLRRRAGACRGGGGRGADQRCAGGGDGDHGRLVPGFGRSMADQMLPADLYLRAGQARAAAYLDETLQARISQ